MIVKVLPYFYSYLKFLPVLHNAVKLFSRQAKGALSYEKVREKF
jgi:hypothetical protein